jgi:hypothetical protein
MQREIRPYGDRLLQGGGVPIEILVGINTDEVVMRKPVPEPDKPLRPIKAPELIALQHHLLDSAAEPHVWCPWPPPEATSRSYHLVAIVSS